MARGDMSAFPGWASQLADLPRCLDDRARASRRFAPAVDVSESADRYIVHVELPGTDREDVSVELHRGILTIRGEKRRKEGVQGEHQRHAERCFGAFTRSFSLPANVDGDQVEARFAAGVLTVEIPKRPELTPKRVDIKG